MSLSSTPPPRVPAPGARVVPDLEQFLFENAAADLERGQLLLYPDLSLKTGAIVIPTVVLSFAVIGLPGRRV